MSRLVCYSLHLSPDSPRPDLLRQLVTSLETLRTHNTSVRVVVFLYDAAPAALGHALASYRVETVALGSYRARLARLCPDGADVLATYPLLHRFLNFREIAVLGPSQVLCLDCDTLFFGDVDRLFARYASAHCYAREEPSCRRSPFGYDPGYVDEDALAAIAAMEGVPAAPPFNLGVVLFNHGVWSALAALDRAFVTQAWRHLVWLASHPSPSRTSVYGETETVRVLREQPALLRAAMAAGHALPYPSANEWILDEVSFWLTLGRVPGVTYGDLAPRQVPQNGELLSERTVDPDWIVCHYYSQNTGRMERWLHDLAEPAAGAIPKGGLHVAP